MGIMTGEQTNNTTKSNKQNSAKITQQSKGLDKHLPKRIKSKLSSRHSVDKIKTVGRSFPSMLLRGRKKNTNFGLSRCW